MNTFQTCFLSFRFIAFYSTNVRRTCKLALGCVTLWLSEVLAGNVQTVKVTETIIACAQMAIVLFWYMHVCTALNCVCIGITTNSLTFVSIALSFFHMNIYKINNWLNVTKIPESLSCSRTVCRLKLLCFI